MALLNVEKPDTFTLSNSVWPSTSKFPSISTALTKVEAIEVRVIPLPTINVVKDDIPELYVTSPVTFPVTSPDNAPVNPIPAVTIPVALILPALPAKPIPS